MRLDELTFEIVHPLVGSSFAIEGRDDVALKIVDVCKVMERVRSQRLKRQPFSIFLLGPAEMMLPQGMYPLHHQELGGLPIFIVPIGRKEEGFEYEAVFT